jgi:RHS repeat-associated protein
VTQKEYTSTAQGYGDLLSAYDGTSAKYYEPDALGSTDALADQAQSVVDRWRYRAFGTATQTLGTDSTPYTWVGRQGYQSDAETGLYLLGARYHDPVTLQFLSRNSLGFATREQNPFQYVGNSPLNVVNTSGLMGGSADFASGDRDKGPVWVISKPRSNPEYPNLQSALSPEPKGALASFALCCVIQIEQPKPPQAPKGGRVFNRRAESECCRDALAGRWDKGDWGAVICCDGRKVICDWSPWANDLTIPGGIFAHCLREHEFVHFKHIGDCPKTAPSMDRLPFKRGWEPAKSECEAYTAQQKCLEKHYSLCDVEKTESKKTKCRKEFLNHINLILGNANKLYGCGFVLYPADVLK